MIRWLQRALDASLRRTFAFAIPYASPIMEAEFVRDRTPLTVGMSRKWAVATALYLSLQLGLFAPTYDSDQSASLIVVLCYAVMIAWLLVMAVATCCARDSALAGSNAVFGTTVGLVMLTIVLTHVQILSADATTVRDNLSELVDFLDANPVANAQLQQYLRLELCQRFLLGQVAFFFFIMNNMQYTIYTLWGVLAHALSATILVVSVCLSPAVPSGGQLFLIYLLVPILSSYYDCANISTSRRHLYATQYNLRHALERKSAALLEAWTVEQAQREASQEADSILNHILKNIMADAAGCIDMFLENVDGDQHLLQQALGGLYRGMRWCKHRQAILRITAGGDCAVVEAPVDVNELGYALVLGRDVDHRFEEGTVLLDSTLCSIVLDNAINNAFRHGCQKDPQVRFTIEVGPPTDPEATDVRRVAFTISNRANPARPVISQELIDKFLAQTAPTTSGSLLSDHLGLRHMFAAAAAQRMTVALSQDDGVVTFEASVEARVCSMTRMNSTKAPADFGAMPEGLRILCLDDSEVARKLLVHCLHAHIRGSEVRAFGRDPAEVDAFLRAAFTGADILVMDQHLTFGNDTFLGTDLVRQLLAGGFRGCLCVRSANAMEDDIAMYLASGAHFTLAKDLRPRDTAAQLAGAYLRFRALAASPAATSALTGEGMSEDSQPPCDRGDVDVIVNVPLIV